ncbi:twin arginine-targeting protein translocase, TatA/E family [Synechococcus sp. PCC 7502]|uniref:twin-arginine translocase TatA/TatE family subunit n=1 Tax=Synechococcus sp. PCC 7502 TaxID=1173263 RepID=UPI00029FF123|nr:twin-arginine translocase TatA/TatE family subunit [Synechococcus sp. PCC 7502]AFY73881.1 twin arginine-targeting protein translocase, TatA/E family [Synechococcus sp. PCC 7502]
MFGLGLPEMIIISVVGVAIFGAKRIPELGKSIGQTIRGFKQGLKEEPDLPGQPSKTDNNN